MAKVMCALIQLMNVTVIHPVLIKGTILVKKNFFLKKSFFHPKDRKFS